jgi:23S rRNA (guanosine2251-2'-O)-methyltransferase
LNTEILYAVHAVGEALKAGRRKLFTVYVSEDRISKRLERVVELAASLKVSVKTVKTQQLKFLSKTDHHQGIAAEVSPYPCARLSDILNKPRPAGINPLLLLLDNVVDPHNLGALVRTAFCVGVDGIVVPANRSAPPSPAVSKASAGALEHVFLARVPNMVSAIRVLKEKGLWIAGMDRGGKMSIFDSNLTPPLAIIVGGEEKGIRPLVKKHCDFLLSIPQAGKIDSLNVSVAGAVALYETFRQREFIRKDPAA